MAYFNDEEESKIIHEFWMSDKIDADEYMNELESMSGRIKQYVLELMQDVTRMENEVNTELADLLKRRASICRSWARLQGDAQMNFQDRMDDRFKDLENAAQDVINRIGPCIKPLAGKSLDEFIRSLEEHSVEAKKTLTNIRAQRSELGKLAQLPGDKIEATDAQIDKLISSLRPQCQQQVLPPSTNVSIQSRTSITVALADLDSFRVPITYGAGWRSMPIGAGAQGTVTAHEYVTADGNVINRIVRKDTNLRNSFSDPAYWHGDSSESPFAGKCLPLEYHTQKLVCSAPLRDSNNTVKLVGPPHIMWNQRTHRLYMEFVPLGDVGDLIKRQDRHDEPFPATFLWLAFRALLNNCLIMKQGAVSYKISPWSQIVHCDLKAINVFVGAPNHDYYPQYPTLMLGDFGLAFSTNDKDVTNPAMWAGRGTDGHWAPEQIHWAGALSGQPMNHDKMLSPCNVFGIATVMFQLMERRVVLPLTQHWRCEDDKTILEFSEQTERLYGRKNNGLCDLVSQCLHSDPARRPNVEDLLDLVEDELDNSDRENERSGYVDPNADNLLLHGDAVNLQWASRLREGLDGIDATRVPRGPPSASPEPSPRGEATITATAGADEGRSTENGDSDEDMTDVEGGERGSEYSDGDSEMTDGE